MLEMYCLFLMVIVGVAGALEGEPRLVVSKRTLVSVWGFHGKRHILREKRIVEILESIGA